MLADGKRDYFGFIRQINESLGIPSILVECAFVDSNDVKIIDTLAEQQVMGIAIAKGILKTLGIAYKAETKVEAPTTSKIYRVQVGAYASKPNAEAMQKKLKSAGFDAIIV